MPARSDHIRRDAMHAARSDVQVAITKFVRRLTDEAYAHIEHGLASHDGGVIDGTRLGRDAAAAALVSYIGPGDPREAIEADTPAIESSVADA